MDVLSVHKRLDRKRSRQQSIDNSKTSQSLAPDGAELQGSNDGGSGNGQNTTTTNNNNSNSNIGSTPNPNNNSFDGVISSVEKVLDPVTGSVVADHRLTLSGGTQVTLKVGGIRYDGPEEEDDQTLTQSEDEVNENRNQKRSKRIRLHDRRNPGRSSKKGRPKVDSDDESSVQNSSQCSDSGRINCRTRILKRGGYVRDMLEFSVEPIRHLFECFICHGFYREPYTITKCLHTFCKSCLLLSIFSQQQEATARRNCPRCHEYLGNDWTKVVLPDRSLEHLMDKVLFVDMAAADAEAEAAFYSQRGIQKKPDVIEEKTESLPARPPWQTKQKEDTPAWQGKQKEDRNNDTSKQNQRPTMTENVHLVPLKTKKSSSDPNSQIPSLENPFLEVPGNIRVGQLKKYLAMKLPSELRGEIYFNGASLGNEWTVEFVRRTLCTPSYDSSLLIFEFR